MKLNSNCPLSEEQIAKYDTYIERLKDPIAKSKLPLLYCVLLQASFELEANKNLFEVQLLNIFTGELFSKFLNEGWAIIGCYERAAFLASFHHTRASLELLACYHWTIYKENKIRKRVQKYYEFKDLYLYNYYMKYAVKQTNDELSFIVTEDQIKIWQNKVEKWKTLFNINDNDLTEVVNWHHGCTIENMLSEFPNNRIKMLYDETSHATHFSPYSHEFGTDDTVLGLPINMDGDLTQINKPVKIYLESLEFLLSMFSKSIGFDSKVKFPKQI